MRLIFGAIVALALAPVCAGEITDKQVKELPAAELANLALGQAGQLMIDVDRPQDGSLKWATLRFYGRASVTGSQFGMCGSDWVTLHYDDQGSLESIDAERRYGVEGPIYRQPGKWTSEESGKICDAVESTREYFPAPGAQDALRIAKFVDAIAVRGPFSKQSFSFKCTGICNHGRSVLRALKLSDIDRARSVDCDSSALEMPSCFELVVGENRVGPFPKTFRIYGSHYMNKVVISSVTVDVGSTLE